MGYTFEPKEPHARAYGNNLDISTKNAQKICRVIRGKRLSTAKKILDGLITQKKSIDGKYYTKAANAILSLLRSAEKNADFRGLDIDSLHVHISASRGVIRYRGRRKADFGRRMKFTNVEVILIEKNKPKKKEKEPEKQKKKTKDKSLEQNKEAKKTTGEKAGATGEKTTEEQTEKNEKHVLNEPSNKR